MRHLFGTKSPPVSYVYNTKTGVLRFVPKSCQSRDGAARDIIHEFIELINEYEQLISSQLCKLVNFFGQICDASYSSKPGLTTHMTSHSSGRPFPNPHCDKSFKTRSTRGENVKRIHSANFVVKKPHKCVHCGKKYPRKSYLEGHNRSAHTGERPFACAERGRGFALGTMLTEYLKDAHGMGRVGKERLPRSKRKRRGGIGSQFRSFNEDT